MKMMSERSAGTRESLGGTIEAINSLFVAGLAEANDAALQKVEERQRVRPLSHVVVADIPYSGLLYKGVQCPDITSLPSWGPGGTSRRLALAPSRCMCSLCELLPLWAVGSRDQHRGL